MSPAVQEAVLRVETAPAPQMILGVPVAPIGMRQMLDLCESRIAARQRLLIGVVNAAKIVNMRRDERLRNAVLAADVIVADGMAVVWASSMLGQPLPERVAGIDLMSELLLRGNRRRWSVYLLGASQEVLDGVVETIERDCPGVEIAGARHGYYKPNEERQIVEEIRTSQADILLVAMGSPRKEEFLAKYADYCGVPVCHGVGGAFDVVSGKVRRAPGIWQRLGLEWLYRLVQEPGRLWQRYLNTNTVFIWMVLWAVISRRFRRARAAEGAQP